MKESSGGFTLIELMLVVFIILILSGASISAYLSFNKSQTINNDARNLSAEIFRVRTLASSLQYPAGCDSLKGYLLRTTSIDGELAGVYVTADCDPADVVSSAVKILTDSIFVTPFEATFLPGSGYLSGGADQIVTIRDKNDAAYTKDITIGVYGTVSGI